jgi:hypothetical protein
VTGWGRECGSWWGECSLRGTQQVAYGLLPHTGRWDEAGISRGSCSWSELPMTQVAGGRLSAGEAARLPVRVSGNGMEIPVVFRQGKSMLRTAREGVARSPRTRRWQESFGAGRLKGDSI